MLFLIAGSSTLVFHLSTPSAVSSVPYRQIDLAKPGSNPQAFSYFNYDGAGFDYAVSFPGSDVVFSASLFPQGLGISLPVPVPVPVQRYSNFFFFFFFFFFLLDGDEIYCIRPKAIQRFTISRSLSHPAKSHQRPVVEGASLIADTSVVNLDSFTGSPTSATHATTSTRKKYARPSSIEPEGHTIKVAQPVEQVLDLSGSQIVGVPDGTGAEDAGYESDVEPSIESTTLGALATHSLPPTNPVENGDEAVSFDDFLQQEPPPPKNPILKTKMETGEEKKKERTPRKKKTPEDAQPSPQRTPQSPYVPVGELLSLDAPTSPSSSLIAAQPRRQNLAPASSSGTHTAITLPEIDYNPLLAEDQTLLLRQIDAMFKRQFDAQGTFFFLSSLFLSESHAYLLFFFFSS